MMAMSFSSCFRKRVPPVYQNGRDSFGMFSAYTYSDKLEWIDMHKIELYTPFFF